MTNAQQTLSALLNGHVNHIHGELNGCKKIAIYNDAKTDLAVVYYNHDNETIFENTIHVFANGKKVGDVKMEDLSNHDLLLAMYNF